MSRPLLRLCSGYRAILFIEHLAQLRTGATAPISYLPSVFAPDMKETADLQFRSRRSFVRSLTSIVSSDRTASLMSRLDWAPTWPATSLSNLALISSQVNGWVGNPG